MSQPIVVPDNVSKQVLPGERVLFTGTFDRARGNLQPINNINATMFTVPSPISINPEGFNLLNFQTFVVNDKSSAVNFVNETFNITSWNDAPLVYNKEKVGQIQFNGLYNNEQNTSISVPGVIRFMVTGNDGIFNNVTAVLLHVLPDFTRFIYFLGRN